MGIDHDPVTNQLYYSLRNDGLYTMDTDGGNSATLLSGQGAVQGVALDIDERVVYWSAVIDGVIRKADMDDGTNISDVGEASGAWHIAFMPSSGAASDPTPVPTPEPTPTLHPCEQFPDSIRCRTVQD